MTTKHEAFCNAPNGFACGCRSVVLPAFRELAVCTWLTLFDKDESEVERRPHLHCGECGEREILSDLSRDAVIDAARAFAQLHHYHTVATNA